MERDLYSQLIDWKNKKKSRPLILRGARQVGKTYLLQYFGKSAYKDVVYLNFEKQKSIHYFFEQDLEPKRIIQSLEIFADQTIDPENTLIIFDEIQDCPNALNSLKYFDEEASGYQIVAAGSLLGVKLANTKGFPVGKVEFLDLSPLSFFEFLTALGKDRMRAYLENKNETTPIEIPLHQQLIELLKIYYFVGGMPAAVEHYVETENFNEVRSVHLSILNAYELDFAKHAPAHSVMKITQVWKSLPAQLAKENKKFIFSLIRSGARAREYEVSIQWLVDAGLFKRVFHISKPGFPLSAYCDRQAFKIYALDVGLLGAMSGLSARTVIDDLALFTEFKGSLTENFVLQELLATNKVQPFYWSSAGTAEVDFVFAIEDKIYPLEVKSGLSLRSKSLHSYEYKYHPDKLLRVSLNNLKADDKFYNYPLYLVTHVTRRAKF